MAPKALINLNGGIYKYALFWNTIPKTGSSSLELYFYVKYSFVSGLDNEEI